MTILNEFVTSRHLSHGRSGDPSQEPAIDDVTEQSNQRRLALKGETWRGVSSWSMLTQVPQDSFQQFMKRVDLLRTQTLHRASTHPRRALHNRLAQFLRMSIETNQLSTAVRPIGDTENQTIAFHAFQDARESGR